MSRCHTALVAALLFACLPEVICAQTPPRRPTTIEQPRMYFIRGTVRAAANETTVSNVKVELHRFSGEVMGIVFSRSNGEFEFNNVPSGEYVLLLDEEGYEPVREKIEVMQAPRYSVQLYLKRPARLGMTTDGSPISARELALPRKARDSLRKGRQHLFERKEPSASVNHFRRTLAEAPEYYEALHLLGIAYMDLGQFAEAEKVLRECIAASNGRFAEAHFALAAIHSNSQRFSDAETSARTGISIDSAAWQGPFELARALFGGNSIDEAARQLQLVRDRNPAFPPTYLLSANINLRKKDLPAVLRDLDEYLRLEPTGGQSHQAREMRAAIIEAQKPPPAPPANPPKP